MSNNTQKALFVTEVGKPVTLGTRAIPTPGLGEVLIKVAATQLLPHDTYGRDRGLFIGSHLPFILGSNISGTIISLGPSFTKYKLGDHIFGPGSPLSPTPDSTGLQEYATLSAFSSALVPEGFSDDEMATLPINAMTSYAALFGPQYFGFPAPGSRVAERFAYEDIKLVILGARSVVGKFGIQFAKLVGIGTIIVTASLTPDSEKELKELGATKVIDRHSKTVIEDIWDAAGGKGEVGYVYDCVNWTYELAAELVSNKEGNKIMVLHRANSAVSELEKRGKGGVEAKVVVGGDREGLRGVLEVFWERIGECIVEGKVQIPRFRIIEGLDEERVNEALDSYRDGGRVVQAVVHPNARVEG